MVGGRFFTAAGLATMLWSTALLGAPEPSGCTRYTKAVVYHIGWDVETRQRLVPDDVRRNADCIWRVLNPEHVLTFCDRLRLPTCPSGKPVPGDARLVIDFTTDDGRVESYYASWFELMTADSTCRRTIDEAFRGAFDCGRELGFGG